MENKNTLLTEVSCPWPISLANLLLKTGTDFRGVLCPCRNRIAVARTLACDPGDMRRTANRTVKITNQCLRLHIVY